MIASAIANWSLGRPEKSLEPKDFPLPLLQVPEKRRRMTRGDRKRAEMQLRSFFARKAVHSGAIRIKGGPE